MNVDIIKEIEEYLISPSSEKRLFFDAKEMIIHTEDRKEIFPSEDGIFDLVPDKLDPVSKAYDKYSDKYDSYVRGDKLLHRMVKVFTFAIRDDFEYAKAVTDLIPEDFEGILVDIPTGTGIFMIDKFKQIPKAKIVCIDYSIEMLKLAKKRFVEEGIDNVVFLRGDVSNLPFNNEAIDLLVTMSGIEVFKNREQAINEMARVTKNKGRMIGCTHVRKVNRIRDFFYSISSKSTKLITYPYYTKGQLLDRFEQKFNTKQQYLVKSKLIFELQKK